jgi:hypothetical protein
MAMFIDNLVLLIKQEKIRKNINIMTGRSGSNKYNCPKWSRNILFKAQKVSFYLDSHFRSWMVLNSAESIT